MTTTSVALQPDTPARRGRGKARRSLELVEAARSILEAIQPATVRAVCYQLFTRKLISAMTRGETNRVSSQLVWAREAGVIPWSWVVDETRKAERIPAWGNPEQFVRAVKRSYRRDRWVDQRDAVEVWSEKGTVRGTLAPVLEEYGVTFRVMHGYGSTTQIHEIAEETAGSVKGERIAFYVGDWDPSGLHMSEVDLPRRVDEYGGKVSVRRVALLEDDTSDLTSFEADSKRADPRYRWFVDRYGTRCWELDAMSPAVLRERVEDEILARIEWPAWERADVAERAEQESLTSILNAWPGISRQVQKC